MWDSHSKMGINCLVESVFFSRLSSFRWLFHFSSIYFFTSFEKVDCSEIIKQVKMFFLMNRSANFFSVCSFVLYEQLQKLFYLAIHNASSLIQRGSIWSKRACKLLQVLVLSSAWLQASVSCQVLNMCCWSLFHCSNNFCSLANFIAALVLLEVCCVAQERGEMFAFVSKA